VTEPWSFAQLDAAAQDKITQVNVCASVRACLPSCLADSCVCARTCVTVVKLDHFLPTLDFKLAQAIVSKATELREASSGAPVPVAVPNKPAVDAAAAAAAAVGESAPSTAASASGSKDETQRLLFSLDVNLGGAQGKVPLDVHAGAVPADLAQQFATQYGLGSTAVTQLTEAIVNEAKQKVRVRVSSDLGTRWHAQLVASMRSLLQR
jgi:hypothetical protein